MIKLTGLSVIVSPSLGYEIDKGPTNFLHAAAGVTCVFTWDGAVSFIITVWGEGVVVFVAVSFFAFSEFKLSKITVKSTGIESAAVTNSK